MQLDEHALRTLTLARTIETEDGAGVMVSPAERDLATRTALQQARERGASGADLFDDVLQARARAIVQAARKRTPSLAWLDRPPSWHRALVLVMLAGSLVLGIASDLIPEPHRVDLVPIPLLLLLAWNLFVYAVIVAKAFMGRDAPSFLLPYWHDLAHYLRTLRRGSVARIAVAFHERWHLLTSGLQAQRLSLFLHLAAAGWAAGIVLSLIGRGVFRQYAFGWESTFLDAPQVHTILRVVFAPLMALLPIEPFTLQEIAAARNFRGTEGAGRWVLMYAAIVTLVVIVPRLALAAWAAWRLKVLRSGLVLDRADPYLQALAASMPGRFTIGVVIANDAKRGAIARLWPRSVESPQGDQLLLAVSGADDAPGPVDAVLLMDEPATLPAAWVQAPHAALAWHVAGVSWVREGHIFDALAPLLPASRRVAWERLHDAWQDMAVARLDAAMAALAAHLAESAASLGTASFDDAYMASSNRAMTALTALHGLPADFAMARTGSHPMPALRPDLTAVQTASAGAAAGAGLGVVIDVATAGATLGAGAGLGGLLGGALAWMMRLSRRKGASQDLLRHIVEEALLSYLTLTQLGRSGVSAGDAHGPDWSGEAVGAVAARWEEVERALQRCRALPQPPDSVPSLARLLEKLALGSLLSRYPDDHWQARRDRSAAPAGM